MSVIQLLVMLPERRPTIEEIRSVGAASEIVFVPHEADLAKHTEFLPVQVGTRETGFEYYFDALDLDVLPSEATRFGSHHMVARTGGDFAEMLASLLFFRAAASLSGGAYVCPDDGIIVPPSEVDGYLSEQIWQVQKFVK